MMIDRFHAFHSELIADEFGDTTLEVTADRTDQPIEVSEPDRPDRRLILSLVESKRLRKALKRAEKAHRAAIA